MRLYSFVPLFLILFLFLQFQHKETCVEDICFNIVKIADSAQERSQGLMNVEHLEENDGMMFVFPESGRHGFWMKNTLISLDIIWINKEGYIVDIYYGAIPCIDECPVMYPKDDAKYVLEVNAGKAGDWIGKKVE